MRINPTSNVSFAGTKLPSVVKRNLISKRTEWLFDMSDFVNANEYRGLLQRIKKSKKKIPQATLNTEVEHLVLSIKYPGSYRNLDPNNKLIDLLQYIKSIQPEDFKGALAELVKAIGRG